MLKIDFCSDLHMEINTGLFPKSIMHDTPGDILILAGDTLTYRHFNLNRTDSESRAMRKRFKILLEDHFADYKHIIMIPGNHEYYGHYFYGSDQEMTSILKNIDSRIQLMNDDFLIIDNTAIICSTLWVDFDKGNPLVEIAVQDGMNDFRVIKVNDLPSGSLGNTFKAHHACARHVESLKFIKQAYEEHNAAGRNIIVATHHGPSYQSHNTFRFGDSDLKHGYLSELDPWIIDTNIKYWIHGHTHHDINYMIGNTNVISSMYGYAGYDRFTDDFKLGRIEI